MFGRILGNPNIPAVKLGNAHAKTTGQSLDVFIIHNDLQGLAAVSTGETVDLLPDVVRYLLNNRIEFRIGQVQTYLQKGSKTPVLGLVVARVTLNSRYFSNELVRHGRLPLLVKVYSTATQKERDVLRPLRNTVCGIVSNGTVDIKMERVHDKGVGFRIRFQGDRLLSRDQSYTTLYQDIAV